jgi:hypothetical protein
MYRGMLALFSAERPEALILKGLHGIMLKEHHWHGICCKYNKDILGGFGFGIKHNQEHNGIRPGNDGQRDSPGFRRQP